MSETDFKFEQDLEGKAIGYFQKAHDCLRKCKSAADISSLNKTIALLAQAASTCPKAHPQYSECYNQFATALLIRFIYIGKAEDVQDAVNLRAGPVLGHPVEVNQSTVGFINDRCFMKIKTYLYPGWS